MRNPSARPDGRGDLTVSFQAAGAALDLEPGHNAWLLIGNSRWHWAVGHSSGGLSCWSCPPPSPGGAIPLALLSRLRAWAAVGPVPEGAGLDPSRRLHTGAVPLAGLPDWIGVDRALVAWRAWRLGRTAALVADAGTALSLTRVNRDGVFAGGRIQAGRALQLRSLAEATSQLPWSTSAVEPAAAAVGVPWPSATAEAMEQGVRLGMAAAVQAAWQDLRLSDPECRLWVTGGDGTWLAPALGVACQPDLALAALAALSSGPDRQGSCQPLSPP